MKKYIALLRGINVGGKNKLSMRELKTVLEQSNFFDVSTYINSGNVIFSVQSDNKNTITQKIEKIIKDTFNLDVPVAIITVNELQELLMDVPSWWGLNDNRWYDTLVFTIHPMNASEVLQTIGQTNEEHEHIELRNNAIFWSANLDYFSRTRWSKIAASKTNKYVTIRTANTMRKILELVTSAK